MKIKRSLSIFLSVVCGAVCLFISSCFFSNSGSEEIVATSVTVRNLPGTISSISLVITADDMETIEVADISPTDTSYTVEVPAGTNRTFAMTILPDTGDFITSYYGEETVEELVAGETADVAITLEIDGTKLLVPDYLNDRVVLMDDITGAGWVEIDYSIAGFTSGRFHPYDVDFDSEGRLYLGNYVGGSGMGDNRIVRMDDAVGTNRIDFSEISYDNGVTAIAVDRINSLVYYASLSSIATEKLLQSNLDGTSPTSLDVTSGVEAIQDIYGMDIDENGILYIAGQNTTPEARIFRYNTATETVTHSYSANLVEPRDVVYKDGSIYVANKGGADNYKILKLNSATISVLEGHYGVDAATENRNQGYFYEPWRFVAIRNKKLHIIDDDYDNTNYLTLEKLIAMDDISGTNWNTFKPEDIGESSFAFYFEC